MYLYLSAAQHTGSAEALELAQELSSWHDDMVMHARALARGRAPAVCDESCPHARAIDLWRAARDILGDAAHQLVFLKAAATMAGGEEDATFVTEDTAASGSAPWASLATSRDASVREENVTK